MKFLSDIRLLLLGLWLGAAVFFIGVAQTAFAVLPQRELAGAVVNRTLSIVNISGLGIAVLLLLLSAIAARNSSKLLLWLDRSLLVIVALACAIGQFVIGFWIAAVKAQMGGRPIDEIAVDDPLRVQFNQLHNYSEWTLLTAMIAALIAFFVIANRVRPGAVGSAATSSSSVGGTTSDPFDFSKPFKKS
jgi:hypothetical protein